MRKKAAFTKVKKKIKELTPEKQELAGRLLDKAIFMDGELVKLQAAIEEKGWTEEYQNGATQKGIKKSTEGDTYNTMIKNYNAVIGALYKMLPEENGTGDELEEFLGR